MTGYNVPEDDGQYRTGYRSLKVPINYRGSCPIDCPPSSSTTTSSRNRHELLKSTYCNSCPTSTRQRPSTASVVLPSVALVCIHDRPIDPPTRPSSTHNQPEHLMAIISFDSERGYVECGAPMLLARDICMTGGGLEQTMVYHYYHSR